METKLPLYARSGVREAWIMGLQNRAMERHTEPFSDGYRLVRLSSKGESPPSEALPGMVLRFDDILG